MNDPTSPGERPAWWQECTRIKADLGLPDYEPPRFDDGAYVHEVVDDLAGGLEAPIRFIGVNTSYPDDWEVRLGDEPLFDIGRRRDEDGNTVYGLTSAQFRERFEAAVEARAGD